MINLFDQKQKQKYLKYKYKYLYLKNKQNGGLFLKKNMNIAINEFEESIGKNGINLRYLNTLYNSKSFSSSDTTYILYNLIKNKEKFLGKLEVVNKLNDLILSVFDTIKKINDEKNNEKIILLLMENIKNIGNILMKDPSFITDIEENMSTLYTENEPTFTGNQKLIFKHAIQEVNNLLKLSKKAYSLINNLLDKFFDFLLTKKTIGLFSKKDTYIFTPYFIDYYNKKTPADKQYDIKRVTAYRIQVNLKEKKHPLSFKLNDVFLLILNTISPS